MRILVIHNPYSGFGSDALFQFVRSLGEARDEIVLRFLGGDFDIAALTLDVEAFDVVVLSGGDGTISSLLYELREKDTVFCVFPSGTANLFYSNIGNAPEPAALARAVKRGESAKVDLGEVSWLDPQGIPQHKGFAIMSGTGFDAQIMQAAISNKALLGEAAYFAAAMSNTKPAVRTYSITIDGVTYTHEGICCLVANNAMIQADIEIVPGCRMDDGYLDVIMVETQHAAHLLHPLLFGLLDPSGKAIGRPHLRQYRGKEISIVTDGTMPFEVDGDVVAKTMSSYRARILPAAVSIIVDEMSRYHG